MSESEPKPAGWYADPENPGIMRHWDGVKFSGAVAPIPQPPRPVDDEPNGVLVALGFVAAFFFPIIGFAVGCAVTAKDTVLGVVMIGCSFLGAAIWYSQIIGFQ